MKRSGICGAVTVLIAMLAMGATASADVHDNAKIFSADAVAKAEKDMKEVEHKHNKQIAVDTFAEVPEDEKANLANMPADKFFERWVSRLGKEQKVNGVIVLICMKPPHVIAKADRVTTQRGDYTTDDENALGKRLAVPLKEKEYDQALSQAVSDIDTAYTDNIVGNAPGARAPVRPRNAGGTGNYKTNQSSPAGSMFGFSLGTLLCLGVGLVIIFSLVKAILSRAGSGGQNYGGGGYGGPGGGQSPGYGGPGYGAPGYGGGGGGSGFGKGFLGGLLGGAVGGYAVDKFEHRNDPAQGSFGGAGGDPGAGSAGNDPGSGSYDSGPSSPGDFSNDSGGGGADFGGGGDSGGGGGDSGGGDGGSSF
jgi:hypothetical protein